MSEERTDKRIPAHILFGLSALAGAVLFIAVYGYRILDFTNIGWLFDNDHDLRQHFFGWCAFRNDPWHFPIGLIDSLSYPNSMSVIYTDSIPLFAVAFKLISPILPQNFQYFGLFGIMCFMLMGGFSSLLLRRFIKSDVCCFFGSVFYIVSAPVIHRMYFHTALAAQWLIVAALVLWVYDDLIGSAKKKIIYWALLGFVCVGIHSYFIPMTGMVLAALMLTRFLKTHSIALPLGEFAAFSASGILNLYILGAFYGGTSAYGPGLGTFNSNLNTFINPWEIGRILPSLPLQNYFQYEGMAYLGVGILFLFIVVAAGMVFRLIRKVPEEAFHSDKIYGRVTIGLFAVSFISAVLPNISFNDIMIKWIPYPPVLERLLGIFRSNGRLIWPAMYILMTAAISFTAYTFRHEKIAPLVIACALIIQMADISNAAVSRRELYMADHPVKIMWDNEDLSRFIQGKDEFIFLYNDNDITMQTAYYGYLHGMRQNNFYFARDIGDKVDEVINLYYSELDRGNIRENAVYILKTEEYENNRQYYDGLRADVMEVGKHVIFKARTAQ